MRDYIELTLVFCGICMASNAIIANRVSHSLKSENTELRKRLDYWECVDRTPEQPGEAETAEGGIFVWGR